MPQEIQNPSEKKDPIMDALVSFLEKNQDEIVMKVPAGSPYFSNSPFGFASFENNGAKKLEQVVDGLCGGSGAFFGIILEGAVKKAQELGYWIKQEKQGDQTLITLKK